MRNFPAWPLRSAIQALSVLGTAWITLNAAYLVQLADQTRTPASSLTWLAARGWFPFGADAGVLSIEDYCPLGPLEGGVRFVQTLVAGEGLSFVGPVTLRNLGVLLALLLLVAVTKKTFCSWLCPFGAVFEGLNRFARRLGIPSRRPSRRWHARLRWGRHLVLALLVVLTAWAGTLVFKPVDPFFALYSLGSGTAAGSAFAVLGVLLLGSLFHAGAWCHYLCPLGGALDPLSRLAPIRVCRSEESCTHCSACSRACPQRIPVAQRTRVRDGACTNCLRCLDRCPEPGALELRLELPR